MQKGLSSFRGISLSLALGLALATLVLVAPPNVRAASNPPMITFSGQRISSIFDGLMPSHFALSSAPKRNRAAQHEQALGREDVRFAPWGTFPEGLRRVPAHRVLRLV